MRYNHPLIFPGFFLAIPAVFWIIVLCVGIPLDSLRAAGWVFEVNGVDSEWYEYWTLFGAIICLRCFANEIRLWQDELDGPH